MYVFHSGKWPHMLFGPYQCVYDVLILNSAPYTQW
jgi:hypothetical protein